MAERQLMEYTKPCSKQRRGSDVKKIKDRVCAAPECFILFKPWNSTTKVCSLECAIDLVRTKTAAKAKRLQQARQKADRAQHKQDKQRITKRTGKKGHYEKLKTALHYYVKHVLRKGEPCYTCGKPRLLGEADKTGAFHVGHFMPAKEIDCRRFMLENLRIQCYSCNAMNSGRRVEYRQHMIDEMGLKHMEWLECDVNHKSLKEQYPDIADIKSEAARYRKLSRGKLWEI